MATNNRTEENRIIASFLGVKVMEADNGDPVVRNNRGIIRHLNDWAKFHYNWLRLHSLLKKIIEAKPGIRFEMSFSKTQSLVRVYDQEFLISEFKCHPIQEELIVTTRKAAVQAIQHIQGLSNVDQNDERSVATEVK